MTPEILQSYWALIIASILLLGVFLFVVFELWRQSRGGRLTKALLHLQHREQALARANKDVSRASARLARLQGRGDSVAPGKVLAAKDELQAAEETVRLLDAQLLVVRNNARVIILEDFPKTRHEALLKRHLGENS